LQTMSTRSVAGGTEAESFLTGQHKIIKLSSDFKTTNVLRQYILAYLVIHGYSGISTPLMIPFPHLPPFLHSNIRFLGYLYEVRNDISTQSQTAQHITPPWHVLPASGEVFKNVIRGRGSRRQNITNCNAAGSSGCVNWCEGKI